MKTTTSKALLIGIVNFIIHTTLWTWYSGSAGQIPTIFQLLLLLGWAIYLFDFVYAIVGTVRSKSEGASWLLGIAAILLVPIYLIAGTVISTMVGAKFLD